MNALFSALDKTLNFLLLVILAAMVVVVGSNVFCRFILNFSLTWGEEVAQILMLYLTFFGAAVAMRENSHYAFEYLIQSLPPRPARVFLALRWVLVILMSILLTYWGAVATVAIREWIMPATGVTRSLVYGACPAGCFLVLLYAARGFFLDMKEPSVRRREEKTPL
jgi:TRAP-type C4-dicarboxylate transport system permease small subunit